MRFDTYAGDAWVGEIIANSGASVAFGVGKFVVLLLEITIGTFVTTAVIG